MSEAVEEEGRGGGWMWKLWLAFLVIAGMSAILFQGYVELRSLRSVAGGQEAPDFLAERYGGGEVRLSDLKGKIVLVDFWATWCGPCVTEMPYLVRTAGEFKDRGVVLLAANQIEADSKAAVGVFLTNTRITLPENVHVLFAPDPIFMDYKIQALPTLYFIDREGKIVDAVQGQISEESLRRRLEKLTGST